MKNLLRFIIVVGLLPTGVLHAQDLTGNWQGTLSSGGRDLRIVAQISKGDVGLTATLFSIDQPGPGYAGTISVENSTIKVPVPAMGAVYEGKLNPEGNGLIGYWIQGSTRSPLNLTRATPDTAWTIPIRPKQMPPDANPIFEVATIKPSLREDGSSLLVNRSGVLNTTGTSLTDLIKYAYGIHLSQIIGGPSWINSEKFDITAKPDIEGLPSIQQLRSMIQKLLQDRFQLTVHDDKRQLPVYAVRVVKPSTALTKNESNPNGLRSFNFQGGAFRTLNARNATMSEFAGALQAGVVDRPVIDQTGFGVARYDFVLKWTPDAVRSVEPAVNSLSPSSTNADEPPDIFSALQQQLGLRLEAVKTEVDVIVIDRAQTPSEN